MKMSYFLSFFPFSQGDGCSYPTRLVNQDVEQPNTINNSEPVKKYMYYYFCINLLTWVLMIIFPLITLLLQVKLFLLAQNYNWKFVQVNSNR